MQQLYQENKLSNESLLFKDREGQGNWSSGKHKWPAVISQIFWAEKINFVQKIEIGSDDLL